MVDLIHKGRAFGKVAEVLMAHNFDVKALRPFVGNDGRSYVSVTNAQTGKLESIPLMNAAATLRKDEWKQLDEVVVKAAQSRLRFVSDLHAAGLVYSIPNGMGKTILQTETQSDINDAEISMDGLRKSQNDRPEYELTSLPLPITHKDFGFSARQLATSRNGSTPLDTSMAELAGRKVGELLEQTFLGLLDTFTFGGGTLYGLMNFPSALTKALTDPTDSAWEPATLLTEVLDMKTKSQTAKHYGPWMLYCAPAWDKYVDDDFSPEYPNLTLRERLKKIEGIGDVRTLDYLEDYSLVLVQMTSDVIRVVNGMNVTTVQWESEGGLFLNFKVMAIQVPQLRADFNSRTGLVVGSVA